MELYIISVSLFMQACRLGQHKPICKAHADGIVTVSTAGLRPQADQPLSDWFFKMCNSINGDSITKLKLYAQVCRHDLGTNLFACIFPFFLPSMTCRI